MRRIALTPWQKVFVAILLLPVALVVAGVAYRVLEVRHEHQFVEKWAGEFSRCRTLERIHALPAYNWPGIYERKFPNGEWVVAYGDCSCCGCFDVTIFFDSTGAAFYEIESYHFCGLEGLCGELDAIKAASLAEFYAAEPAKLQRWQAK